jgi:arginyl-tRNA synthetase
MTLHRHVFRRGHAAVLAAIADLVRAGLLPAGLDTTRVTVEPPKDPALGEMSSNAGMVLAKAAGRPPREIATAIGERLLASPGFGLDGAPRVDGPGFLNWRHDPAIWRAELRAILAAGINWGASDIGNNRPVNVEYVSANPTGPMHIGHGRGAVVGDALAALMEKAGHPVTREYYVNDAGAQVDQLARTVHLRYREALGEVIGPIPDGLYPGDYLKPVGVALAARDGARWRDADEGAWLAPLRAFAIEAMLAAIRADLEVLGIRHAVFSSERALVEAGAVDRALARLEELGLIYVGVLEPPKGKPVDDWEPRAQTLFRSSRFGDDVDRPLRKSDGSWTYFAADIAYHYDKFQRGSPDLIDIWGADHGGYVKRMQAALRAITEDRGRLDVRLCQLVNLTNDGVPVKMSKRAGTFVTLAEVVDEVGPGVVRFMMLTRRNDAPLDFDLKKVVDQSKDNPVFYVQYAHARAASVLRHASEAKLDHTPYIAGDQADALHLLTDPDELAIIRQLAAWPRVVESAAEAREPHRIAFYLGDIAAAFHAVWNRGRDEATMRFLQPDRPELTAARLALVTAVRTVIASGLAVIGVEPVEEMR